MVPKPTETVDDASKNNSRKKGSEADTSISSTDQLMDSDTPRRNFLSGVLGSTTAILGLSGSAAASREVTKLEKEQIRQRYGSAKAIQAAFRPHQDLLSELADKGLLSSGTVDGLKFDHEVDSSVDETVDHQYVTGMRISEEVTPEIRMIRNIDEGVLSVVVFPEHDHIYALLNPHGDDEIKEFGDGPLTNSVSTTDCGSDRCWECKQVCDCPNDSGCCCTSCTCCLVYVCDCYCCKCSLACWGEC